MEKNSEGFQKIVSEVEEKACLKQKIYQNTLKTFKQFKDISSDLITSLKENAVGLEDNVAIDFTEKS